MPVANRVETVHSALSMVLAGEGMAILPACAELGCPTGVVFRPFLDADDAIDVAVCWRRDSPQSVSSEFPEVRGKGDPSGLIVGGLEGLVD